jgi:TatD-related deoxyribonuclease
VAPAALPGDLPVVDHHCHLSPNGEGLGAAQRFRDAGGTHLFLATQDYEGGAPRDLEGYRRQFETTVRLGEAIERELDVEVFAVLAPYPVDLLAQAERSDLASAVELHRSALALAARLVEEEKAVALGEVGRPHFPVAPELREGIDAVLTAALETGRDVGCPVVLHTDDLDAAGFQELAGMAARAAFPPHRLIKHYQRNLLPHEEYLGLVPSYLARRDLVSGSLAQPGPWFWETDFLDDPRRPGAVLDLTTIPRRAAACLAKDPASIDRLRIPFQSSISAVYGFTPECHRRPP